MSANRILSGMQLRLLLLVYLESFIFFVLGMIQSTGGGGAPPGTIGTERPEDYPEQGKSMRYRSSSYVIAASLLLLVGTSICFGGVLS